MLKFTTKSIEFKWRKCEETVDFYEIRYKTDEQIDKREWNYAKTDADENQMTITGLVPDTKYIFQVRGVLQDQQPGEYGPENDEMQTESVEAYLNTFSTQITTGCPSKYQLRTQEIKEARNVAAKTRKLIFGTLLMLLQ